MKKKLLLIVSLIVLMFMSSDMQAEIECKSKRQPEVVRIFKEFHCPAGYEPVTKFT